MSQPTLKRTPPRTNTQTTGKEEKSAKPAEKKLLSTTTASSTVGSVKKSAAPVKPRLPKASTVVPILSSPTSVKPSSSASSTSPTKQTKPATSSVRTTTTTAAASSTSTSSPSSAPKKPKKTATTEGTTKPNQAGATSATTGVNKSTKKSSGQDHLVGARAVSLAWLQTFSKDIDPTWTTTDVVQKIIIPQTLETKTRFTEKLAENEYAKPTFFVSHRWNDKFRELVETLTAHSRTSGLGDPAQTFLWIDIFAVNQHAGAAQEQDLSNLATAIKNAAKGTLLVMDEHGIVLTRIWCLYEIHQTVRRREQNDLVMLLPKDVSSDLMQDVWTSLDVDKAEASMVEDRDRILEEIRASEVDTQALNHKLKDALVKGASLQVDAARASAALGPESLLAALMRSAQLLKLSGHAAQAQPLLEEWITMHQKLKNHMDDAHQLQLATVHHELSDILCDGLARFKEAQSSCENCLSIRTRLLKPDHRLTAATLARQGWILLQMKHYPEAEKSMRASLEMRRRLKPGDDADVASSLGSLATLLKHQGNLKDALHYRTEAMEMSAKVSGPASLPTINHLEARSQLLNLLGKPADALVGLEKSLLAHQRIEGELHPRTAIAHEEIAFTLSALGRLEEAFKHQSQCLRIRIEAFGPSDMRVGISESNLARLLTQMNKLDASLTHFQSAAKIFTKHGDMEKASICTTEAGRILVTLGRPAEGLEALSSGSNTNGSTVSVVSSETAASVDATALALEKLQKYSEALPHRLKALSMLRASLGPDDALVADAEWNVALLLERLTKLPESLKHWEEAERIYKKLKDSENTKKCHARKNHIQEFLNQ